MRAGGVVQGGSTITEQYVKNAYVGDERTYTRKIREAVLAWQLEDQWSKDKILTEYLNTVYYGAGAYGVEAASLTYFHKHVSELNLQEAALLAALPKFPSQYSPTIDPKLGQAAPQHGAPGHGRPGLHHAAEGAAASKQKLGVYTHPPSTEQRAWPTTSPTTSPRVLTKRYGARQVFEGGLKVYTSIDMDWQREAIDVIKSTTGAAGLRLQAVRGPRGHRPQERLHPHHGRRTRLQEDSSSTSPGRPGVSRARR